MKTAVALIIGLAGFVLNGLLGHWLPPVSENLFGTLVVVSMAMCAVGFMPVFLGWPHWRAAFIAMIGAIVVDMAWFALSIVDYAANQR